MEKLALFGKNYEHLIQVISEQCKFNPDLNAEQAYEEIVSFTQNIDNYQIATTKAIHKPTKPDKILQTQNFKYVLEYPYLVIMNKFH